MNIIEQLKALKTKLVRDDENETEVNKEVVKGVVKDIENKYIEKREEEGKKAALKAALELIAEAIKDPNFVETNEQFATLLKELKNNSKIPVTEIAKDLVINVAEETKNPQGLVESIAAVVSDEKIVTIVADENIPLEHKGILAEGVNDTDVREKLKVDIKTEAELKKEKEDIEKLQIMYEQCEELAELKMQTKIREMKVDRSSEKIKTILNQIVAKKIAYNYVKFNHTKLEILSDIVPIEDMYADRLEDITEEEYKKILEESQQTDKDTKEKKKNEELEKEKHGYQFHKKVLTERIEEQLIRKIIERYLKTGEFYIPQSDRMKSRTQKEQRKFLNEIEEKLGKNLNKMQEEYIISQMLGRIKSNEGMNKFMEEISKIEPEKRETIYDLGISLAEDERTFNTIFKLYEQVIPKLAKLPKEYRNTAIEIISQALDKELVQLNSRENKNGNENQRNNGFDSSNTNQTPDNKVATGR